MPSLCSLDLLCCGHLRPHPPTRTTLAWPTVLRCVLRGVPRMKKQFRTAGERIPFPIVINLIQRVWWLRGAGVIFIFLFCSCVARASCLLVTARWRASWPRALQSAAIGRVTDAVVGLGWDGPERLCECGGVLTHFLTPQLSSLHLVSLYHLDGVCGGLFLLLALSTHPPLTRLEMLPLLRLCSLAGHGIRGRDAPPGICALPKRSRRRRGCPSWWWAGSTLLPHRLGCIETFVHGWRWDRQRLAGASIQGARPTAKIARNTSACPSFLCAACSCIRNFAEISCDESNCKPNQFTNILSRVSC